MVGVLLWLVWIFVEHSDVALVYYHGVLVLVVALTTLGLD